MKKMVPYCIIGMLLIALLSFASGCGANITAVNRTATSDDEIADKCLEKIVEAIENKDSDQLSSMFSEDALSENDTELFSQSMKELFSVWQGKTVRYDGELSTSKETKNKKVIRKITGFYDIETTENICHLLFMSTVQDEGSVETEGISMIVYVSDERYQSEDFYWQYGNRGPGIYIDVEVGNP